MLGMLGDLGIMRRAQLLILSCRCSQEMRYPTNKLKITKRKKSVSHDF